MSKAKSASKKEPQYVVDLVVLTADKDTKEAIDGLLGKRSKSLGIHFVKHDSIVHPQRDPGCRTQSAGLLAGYSRTHRHALVVFDREGSGGEDNTRDELEAGVLETLRKAGWDDRAAVVVIDPELENWVWSRSALIPGILGWADNDASLPAWLVENGWLETDTQVKPARPKEAMEAVLRTVKRPRSSAVYRTIAEKVSLVGCADPAFGKLCEILRQWFPPVG